MNLGICHPASRIAPGTKSRFRDFWNVGSFVESFDYRFIAVLSRLTACRNSGISSIGHFSLSQKHIVKYKMSVFSDHEESDQATSFQLLFQSR